MTIVLQHLDRQPGGTFRPGAFVKITSSLRTSGLLQTLAAEDLKSLLFLLSFLTPNGDCQATVEELVNAIQMPAGTVRIQMLRLVAVQWHGKPLAIHIRRETGQEAFALTSGVIFGYEQEAEPDLFPPTVVSGGSREAVIAQSRSSYSTPRAEVERQIAEQMGWEALPEPTTPEEAANHQVWQRLRTLGVSKEEIDLLLSRFDRERIEQQLAWLPYRHANSPARYIVAAIEGDYQPPREVRLREPIAIEDDIASAMNEPQSETPSDPTIASA